MMRLSDAIRLGALLAPQIRDHHFQRNGAGEIIASCAIGAATHAGYCFAAHRPFLDATRRTCPRCGVSGTVLSTIAHLNDWHRWTREAIADWVATLEGEDTEPAPRVAAGRERHA